MDTYVRVKTDKIFWATKSYAGRYIVYNEIKRDGSQYETRRITLALPADIVWEKPATMNKHYAELEITTKLAQ